MNFFQILNLKLNANANAIEFISIIFVLLNGISLQIVYLKFKS